MKKLLLIITALVFLASPVFAKHSNKEIILSTPKAFEEAIKLLKDPENIKGQLTINRKIQCKNRRASQAIITGMKQSPLLLGMKEPLKDSNNPLFAYGGIFTLYTNEDGLFSLTFRPQKYPFMECFVIFGDKLIPVN
jgi:hypothetical protein